MARRTLMAVIAVIATFAILLAMLTGCGSKTPEERFEEWRSNSSVVTTESADILQEKVISLLNENDIIVIDSYISASFLDGIPYITFAALVNSKDGVKEVKSYSVETEYDGPIASAFGWNSDSISVYGEMLYIDSYFENATYSLQGEEIVVME